MKRLAYIDNLRIFLIILVVLHHLLITYGGVGSWYYKEVELEGMAMIPQIMFAAANQAFFMAMFFMISAYFMVASFNKKGPGRFLKDRLLRLGIPTLVYFLLLHPLTIFIILKIKDGMDIGFFQYWWESRYFGFGPMWFVEALLFFTIIYVFFRVLLGSGKKKSSKLMFPKPLSIILFALIIGGLTFIVRIWLPVGWEWRPFGFQLPHFTQYISLFIIGIIAYHNDWFEQIDWKQGIRWFLFAQFLILIVMPVFLYIVFTMSTGIETVVGGLTWESLFYSVWEQLCCVSLIIGLTGIFRKYLNMQGRFSKSMSSDAYTVYIIHAPMLVLIAVLLVDVNLPPILKFIVVAPIALIIIFLVAELLRRLPLIRKIL